MPFLGHSTVANTDISQQSSWLRGSKYERSDLNHVSEGAGPVPRIRGPKTKHSCRLGILHGSLGFQRNRLGSTSTALASARFRRRCYRGREYQTSTVCRASLPSSCPCDNALQHALHCSALFQMCRSSKVSTLRGSKPISSAKSCINFT